MPRYPFLEITKEKICYKDKHIKREKLKILFGFSIIFGDDVPNWEITGGQNFDPNVCPEAEESTVGRIVESFYHLQKRIH